MGSSDISKKNTEVILYSIVSDNIRLYAKIRKIFPELTTVQSYTILLLKLGYTFNEVRILLGVAEANITEANNTIINSNYL